VTTERVGAGSVTAPQYSVNTIAPDGARRRRHLWLQFASYAGLISYFLSLTAYNLVDVDIWHEMALIRESLRAGHLLTRDVFAYTPHSLPVHSS
jgi:hypothetical protein